MNNKLAMRIRYLIIFLLFYGLACNTERHDKSDLAGGKTSPEANFDKIKWSIKEGKDYPYRDQMLNAVVYNDTIRMLNKDQIVELLGEPDYVRDDNFYLYYRITETRLAFWSLHTKTLVIKLTDDNIIDWIKIHE